MRQGFRMDIALPDIAIWVVTPNGCKLARRLQEKWSPATLWSCQRLSPGEGAGNGRTFTRLSLAVRQNFDRYDGHIFIMATGIAVRMIAPLLRDKTVDPAVVVVDDQGRFAISLVAGHMGGANHLADRVARILGATAVITTATDVNGKPAVDLLALEKGLKIENPQAIKVVNMALLTNEKLWVHDPFGMLGRVLSQYAMEKPPPPELWKGPGVYVDDQGAALAETVLMMRPLSLCAGIGCNRHVSKEEIDALLRHVFEQQRLSLHSLGVIASIDLKADEAGLLAMAHELHVPLRFFAKNELNQVLHVPNPSAMAAKHVGVKSVCEAAAILAAHHGELIVPKHKTGNVTVAIARRRFMSSASVPAV
jgi:cobalt-precorrin 5A hydrolase